MKGVGTRFAILGAAMVITLGIFAVSYSDQTTSSQVASYENIPHFLGHVTMKVTDSDGNIKSYIQTDNVVTSQGLQCALHRITAATGGCGGTDDFKRIALSSNASGTSAAGDTGADFALTEVARADGTAVLTGDASLTITNEFTAIAASGVSVGVELNATETVAETALFDSDTLGGGNMLAVTDLSATTVVVGDTITVTWTITGE